MLLPKFLSRKKLSENIARFLVKNRSCDRRQSVANQLVKWSVHFHPKTLLEIWLNASTRVSVNSENCMVFQWAVRVCQRLSRDSVRAAQSENWIWYKLSRKCRQLGGVSQTLRRHSQFLSGAARSVLVDYREGLRLRPAGYKLCSVEKMTCSWRSWKYSAPFGGAANFSWPLVSLRPARDMNWEGGF